MNTGGYDKKISFISMAGTSDGKGGTIPGRVILISTFASVKQESSISAAKYLALQGNQDVLNKVYKIKIRYRASFLPTEDMFIAYRGYDLTIQNVQLTGERARREYIIQAVFNDKTSSITT